MKTDFNKAFGSRVREAREKMGISREKLAELVGFSSRFLAHVENGESGVKLENVHKLCVALGTTSDYLLFGINNPDNAEIVNRLNQLDDEHKEYINAIINAYTDIYLKSN